MKMHFLLRFLFQSVALLIVLGAEQHLPQSSSKEGDSGPSGWYKKHEGRGLNRQSPIAFWKNDMVVDSSLPNLQLYQYDVELKGLKLENNGQTTSVTLRIPLKLRQLLPMDISNFYTYNGSLTTPPCNEVVIWSIFTQTSTITSSQLEEIRSIKVHNIDETVHDEWAWWQNVVQPPQTRSTVARSFSSYVSEND